MRKFLLGTVAAALTLSLAGAPAIAAGWQGNDRHDNNRHDNDRRGNDRGKHHGWSKGQRLPAQYRSYRNVDWRSHHLRQPPRGYHWVQVDDDYVLAALTTGIILELALANR